MLPKRLSINSSIADLKVYSWPLGQESVADTKYLESLMAEDELKRSYAFATPDLVRRAIISRGTLRLLLGEYLNCPPRALVFEYGPSGKPAIKHPSRADWEFNLSHSGDWAILALAKCPIGIDIEQDKPNFDYFEIVHQCFGRSDKETLLRTPIEQRRKVFFQMWTAKEAVAKALGQGVGFGLEEVELEWDAAHGVQLLGVAGEKHLLPWKLDVSYVLDGEYHMAIAALSQ